MGNDNFYKYLNSLGFSENEIFFEDNIFTYKPHLDLPELDYILVDNEKHIYDYHKIYWNKNDKNVFVAVTKEKTFLIDVKQKPNFDNPIAKNICIKSFDYGINSNGFQDVNIEEISKNYISSTFFYKFIQNKHRKKQEVDKDLLLNLIALREDLIDNNNEEVIHLLILRSLFIKYLEDREIFNPNSFSNILKSNSPSLLINAFNEIHKINGDVFGNKDLFEADIKVEYLEKLHRFFTTDYQSGQGTLFPYNFNYIPIQLISHVYEAFLKNNTKKGKGVYYTPNFIVNFMLSQTLTHQVKNNHKLTILDPAVGSGAFLVESFKIIRDSYENKLNYFEKKKILETQLFGIDIDRDALQITAFSLYLALLEDESPEFIKNEIDNSHPILPSLIGKTLFEANTIIDPVLEDVKFDFIISNPPWGSVPSEQKESYINERNAIDNTNDKYPEYVNIADYERSQAFIMRISKWQKENTLTVMIVKNSIFLNDKVDKFRRELLEKYEIKTFYELSHYNRIIFKKRVIGKVRGKQSIEIGASEPASILIFQPNKSKKNYTINYISPKLTSLGEYFELIQYTDNESFLIKKEEFINNDILWRILVNSDYEAFDLIKTKILPQKELIIEARTGFQPKKDMLQLGEPIWKKIIKPNDFESYNQITESLGKFNWNQKLRRKGNENRFLGSRIIVPVRPLKKDELKFRAIHLQDEVVYSDDIISIKLKRDNNYINTFPYLALFNSKLLNFYFYQISSQWGKGEEKRPKLRNVDIETLPIKNIKDVQVLENLNSLVEKVCTLKKNNEDYQSIIDELDNLIFNIYNLTEYEKAIINEFYEVNVERKSKGLEYVNPNDIQSYFDVFKNTFSLILSSKMTLIASYNISTNVGAIIKFSIVEQNNKVNIEKDNTLQILRFVKSKQLNNTEKLFKEEKIKIYEKQDFYLIKSNQFKDWTKRQAIKDAKEEIEFFIKHLAGKNDE